MIIELNTHDICVSVIVFTDVSLQYADYQCCINVCILWEKIMKFCCHWHTILVSVSGFLCSQSKVDVLVHINELHR